MRRLVLCLVLCACKNKDATPPGTGLIDWDYTHASRAPFTKAHVGARVSKDVSIEWPSVMGATVKATMHVETAPVAFDEDTEHVSQSAPVTVTAKLVDSGDFAITGRCKDGPNYQMPSVGGDGGLVTPMGMVLDCSLEAKKAQSNDILELTLYGDGRIESWGTEKKVTIR